MLRKIRLHPGSNSVVLTVPVFTDFENWHTLNGWRPCMQQDDKASELWIDCGLERENSALEQTIDIKLLEQADKVVVYDWFHASPSLTENLIAWVKEISSLRPTRWISICANPTDNVDCVHYDYYWNRTKLVYTAKISTWKQQHVENFVQYPVHSKPRSHKVLNYHARTDPYRVKLRDFLKQNFKGFYNCSEHNEYLPTNLGCSDQGTADPPGREYYDESYVTCMVESRCLGNKTVVSEKTYDNLIQGRCVMNFANQGFYQYLRSQGWKLPNGVDYSWDSIDNDDQRFDAYLRSVADLLSMTNMHDWFMSNWDCWLHNQQMLSDKPYSVVSV